MVKKAALALLFVSGICSAGVIKPLPPSGPQLRLVYPTAGTELRAGETTTITWEITGLTKGIDLAWCEQEVFVSINGQQQRLSPEMGAEVRKFDWTVPNISAEDAYVVLRFGCQGSSFLPETRYPQVGSAFRIVPGGTASRVEVAEPALADVNGQEGLRVSWKASADFASYQVLASFDKGISFQSLGTTEETSFSFKAPNGTRPLVRVVGVAADGTRQLSNVVRADVAAAD